MAKRKSLSKAVRFEVFKRDRFRCAYCGQSPPAVVLQVDHILAVAQGGGNDLGNLLTSCVDCNLGKSDRPLEQVPKPLKETMAERQEMREQVEEYNRFLAAERDREIELVIRLGTYWCDKNALPADRGRFTVCEDYRQSLRRFLKHLTEVEILDAMDIAHAKYPVFKGYDNRTFRYFCGICWRKIRGRGQEAER